MPPQKSEPKQSRTRKWRVKLPQAALAAVAALFIFVTGVNVGNGRIRLAANTLDPVDAQNNLPADLDYRSVEQVYDALRRTYDGQLDVNELLDGLKEGLVRASGDQYTEYLSADEAEDFDEQLNGSFSGIGAELGKENDVLVIVAPIAGFPAEKAGLKPRDVISKINDEAAYDLSVSEAVNKIRGPVGTTVKLTIIRDGAKELTFEIERSQITIPSVTSEVLEGNIGYLKISRFGEDTARLTRQAARNLNDRQVEGVILDLRGNPGGLLDAAVSVAGIWLPENKLVLQEKRDGRVIKDFTAPGNPVLNGVPTVVLIDEGSASASEIVAGALKDNGVATLVGATTFGKGSVQQLEELVGGGMLKVTIARWYTPGGKNIDQEGIEPDHAVERGDDVVEGADPQQEKALELLSR